MDTHTITEMVASGEPRGVYIRYRGGVRIAETMRTEGIECVRNDELIKQALGPLT